jgi:hypothetical protein
MQDGVHGPGAELIAMPGELFDHAEPEDWLFGGMVKDVEPDKAGIEIAVKDLVQSVIVDGFR